MSLLPACSSQGGLSHPQRDPEAIDCGGFQGDWATRAVEVSGGIPVQAREWRVHQGTLASNQVRARGGQAGWGQQVLGKLLEQADLLHRGRVPRHNV